MLVVTSSRTMCLSQTWCLQPKVKSWKLDPNPTRKTTNNMHSSTTSIRVFQKIVTALWHQWIQSLFLTHQLKWTQAATQHRSQPSLSRANYETRLLQMRHNREAKNQRPVRIPKRIKTPTWRKSTRLKRLKSFVMHPIMTQRPRTCLPLRANTMLIKAKPWTPDSWGSQACHQASRIWPNLRLNRSKRRMMIMLKWIWVNFPILIMKRCRICWTRSRTSEELARRPNAVVLWMKTAALESTTSAIKRFRTLTNCSNWWVALTNLNQVQGPGWLVHNNKLRENRRWWTSVHLRLLGRVAMSCMINSPSLQAPTNCMTHFWMRIQILLKMMWITLSLREPRWSQQWKLQETVCLPIGVSRRIRVLIGFWIWILIWIILLGKSYRRPIGREPSTCSKTGRSVPTAMSTVDFQPSLRSPGCLRK